MSFALRLSVTMLDTYRYGMQNNDMTSEELARELFCRREANIAMRAGTAFHSMLEHDLDPTKAGNEFRFIMPNSLNGTVELGTIREKKYEWKVMKDVVLVGKIDAETDYKCIDHKLTGSFDVERYYDSFQWRSYLVMRNKPNFTYQVFEHSGIPKEPDESGCYEIKIKDYHTLDQVAYKGIEDEVKELVHGLASFALYWKPIVENPAFGLDFNQLPF